MYGKEMIAIPANVLRRVQSMSWITPEGEIIPITGEDMHSDIAGNFPGMPAGHVYPTNYAMDKLGYMKVGNAFDFAYKSGRSTPANHESQFDAMAQIICQAVINFIDRHGPGLPHWFSPPREFRGDPDRWTVHIGDISDGSIKRMSVKRFVNTYGKDDTLQWFETQMRIAEEALIRRQVRMILSELRRRPV